MSLLDARLRALRPVVLVKLCAVLLAAGTASCAAPTQGGNIEVRSGAEARLAMLCRWRHADAAKAELCGESEQENW